MEWFPTILNPAITDIKGLINSIHHQLINTTANIGNWNKWLEGCKDLCALYVNWRNSWIRYSAQKPLAFLLFSSSDITSDRSTHQLRDMCNNSSYIKLLQLHTNYVCYLLKTKEKRKKNIKECEKKAIGPARDTEVTDDGVNDLFLANFVSFPLLLLFQNHSGNSLSLYLCPKQEKSLKKRKNLEIDRPI